jgi:hypothetical protein
MLQDEADMRRDRIVAQDGVFGLKQVAYPEQGEKAEEWEKRGAAKDVGSARRGPRVVQSR